MSAIDEAAATDRLVLELLLPSLGAMDGGPQPWRDSVSRVRTLITSAPDLVAELNHVRDCVERGEAIDLTRINLAIRLARPRSMTTDAVRRVVAERDALRATNAELVEVLGRLSEICIPASRLSTTRGQDALFCARAALAKAGVKL